MCDAGCHLRRLSPTHRSGRGLPPAARQSRLRPPVKAYSEPRAPIALIYESVTGVTVGCWRLPAVPIVKLCWLEPKPMQIEAGLALVWLRLMSI